MSLCFKVLLNLLNVLIIHNSCVVTPFEYGLLLTHRTYRASGTPV